VQVVPADHQAYRLLEEARLRCLHLRSRVEADDGRERLDEIYRALGMAGYLASSRIPSGPRLELLGGAQSAAEAGGSGPGAEVDEGALMRLLVAAGVALDRAPAVPGMTDHVVQAAEHLARAREALGHESLAWHDLRNGSARLRAAPS
jgi:hypothetical protein